jgi:hypothetical protein
LWKKHVWKEPAVEAASVEGTSLWKKRVWKEPAVEAASVEGTSLWKKRRCGRGVAVEGASLWKGRRCGRGVAILSRRSSRLLQQGSNEKPYLREYLRSSTLA